MGIETPTQKTSRRGPVSQTIIDPLQLYDPLLVLFKVKLRLNNWWIIAAMGILSTTGLFGWQLNGRLAVFRVLVGSVVAPLWIGIYLFLPSIIVNLFKRFWENGVIGEYRADRPGSLSYQEFVEKQASLIHSRWWTGIALFLLALYWLYECFFVPNSLVVHAPFWWLRLIMIFVFSINIYTDFLVIVWLFIIGVATNRLFHVFTIRVKPLHPDSSGGLGLFNHFLWISPTLVMIGVCGALYSTSLNSSGFSVASVVGGVVCYLIIVPLLLIAWLVLPHHAMVQARQELLLPLTDEYERALDETMQEALGDTAALSAGTERLAALQKRYEQVCNNFPTWPIEIVQLRRLVIAVILPFLLALLPLLVDLLKK
jgi:hypothetical protein